MPVYRPIAACLVMLLLWVAYAYTGVSHGQLGKSGNDIHTPSIAIGISGYVGAPGLTAYWKHRHELNLRDKPLDDRIKAAAQIPIVWTEPFVGLEDGNNYGFAIFSMGAFMLLGPSAASLYWGFILLIGASAAAFCAQYRRDPVAMAAAATVLLAMILQLNFTAVGHFIEIDQVYGIRYFPAAGLIAALHVIFALLHPARIGRAGLALIFLQALLLTLCLMVREASVYFLIVLTIMAGGALLAYLRRRDDGRMRGLLAICAAGIVAFGLFQAVFYARLDASVSKGVVATNTMWHRMLISLGANPAWPIEKVDCDWDFNITGPLRAGIGDANAYCYWINHVREGGGSIDDGWKTVYTDEYGAFIRSQFLRIAEAHPAFMVDTFAYYKPLGAWAAIWQTFRHPENAPQRRITAIAIAGFILIVATMAWPGGRSAWRQWLVPPAVFVLAFAATWIPEIVAWAAIHTNSDTVLNGLCFAVASCIALAAALSSVVSSQKPPAA